MNAFHSTIKSIIYFIYISKIHEILAVNLAANKKLGTDFQFVKFYVPDSFTDGGDINTVNSAVRTKLFLILMVHCLPSDTQFGLSLWTW